MTLKEYWEAKDPETGETFAEFCDRQGITYETAMRGYALGEALEELQRQQQTPAPQMA